MSHLTPSGSRTRTATGLIGLLAAFALVAGCFGGGSKKDDVSSASSDGGSPSSTANAAGSSSSDDCAPGEALFCHLKVTCDTFDDLAATTIGHPVYRAVADTFVGTSWPETGHTPEWRECEVHLQDAPQAPRLELIVGRYPATDADALAAAFPTFPKEHHSDDTWTISGPLTLDGHPEVDGSDDPTRSTGYNDFPGSSNIWLLASPRVFVELHTEGNIDLKNDPTPMTLDQLRDLATKVLDLLGA